MSRRTAFVLSAVLVLFVASFGGLASDTRSATWEDMEPYVTEVGPTNAGYGSGCHRVCKYTPPIYICLENVIWETYCALNMDGSACITLQNCQPCEYPCN